MLPGNHLNPLLKAWQLLLLTPNCNVISLLHVCMLFLYLTEKICQ